MNKGICVVITGAGGTGKSAVIDRLLARIPDSVRLVTTTSREPRGDEQDGVDYHFISTDQFSRMIERGEFLEWQENYGNYYGSERGRLEELLKKHPVVLVGLDIRGAKEYKKAMPEAVTIALFVPPEQIAGRILGRGPIDSIELEKRVETITDDQNEIGIFDFIVENPDGGLDTETVPHAMRFIEEVLAKRNKKGEKAGERRVRKRGKK